MKLPKYLKSATFVSRVKSVARGVCYTKAVIMSRGRTREGPGGGGQEVRGTQSTRAKWRHLRNYEITPIFSSSTSQCLFISSAARLAQFDSILTLCRRKMALITCGVGAGGGHRRPRMRNCFSLRAIVVAAGGGGARVRGEGGRDKLPTITQ